MKYKWSGSRGSYIQIKPSKNLKLFQISKQQRENIISKHNYICQDCKKQYQTSKGLAVHHTSYEDHIIIVLCNRCHAIRHGRLT